MKQNTNDWLAWRRKGLGASDAPIVLGLSEYKTPFQLWQNKLNLLPDEPSSFIAEMGHKFEGRARAQFALETGIDLKPDICKEHPEFPHLRASLDGDCSERRVFAEIKLVGKKKLDWIRENQVPTPEHFPQVQQQFLVTGYERGFYIAYTVDDKYQDITDYVAVPVSPDKLYMKTLFDKLTEFWKLVETQEPPELSPKDIYEFKDAKMITMAKTYLEIKKLADKYAEAEKDLGLKLKAIASVHAKVKLGPLQISKVVRKGSVQYKDIPELKKVNLEKFRGAPSSYQLITEPKEKQI